MGLRAPDEVPLAVFVGLGAIALLGVTFWVLCRRDA
jgi:hypothetical protein